MPSTILAQEAEAFPSLGAHLPPRTNASVAFLVVFGIFISTFAQDKVIGQYPFNYVLKGMHKDATAIAGFFFIAGLAWYAKPILGILSDSFPLFGTRRRSYLLLGSILGAVSWATYMLVPQRYGIYLLLIVLVNTALVLASAVCGGMLVEEGQKASGYRQAEYDPQCRDVRGGIDCWPGRRLLRQTSVQLHFQLPAHRCAYHYLWLACSSYVSREAPRPIQMRSLMPGRSLRKHLLLRPYSLLSCSRF